MTTFTVLKAGDGRVDADRDVDTDSDTKVWVDVAPVAGLPVDRGVAALVDGVPVAVFRLSDGTIGVVDHFDPVARAYVMARGLVGSVGETSTVASPLNKIRYCLDTGVIVDAVATAEPGLARLAVWNHRVADGRLQIEVRPDQSGVDSFPAAGG